jgi:hypothetical protein
MPIDFTCPTCGKRFKAKDEAAGRTASCKGCGGSVRIPGPESPAPEDKPSPEGQAGAAGSARLKPGASPDLYIEFEADEAPSASVDQWLRSASAVPPSTRGVGSETRSIFSGPPSALRIEPDPWYYGFLEVYAKFIMCIGVIQAPVVGILFLSSFGPAPSKPVAVDISGFLISIIIMFSSLLFAAPILLVVDAARNVRESKSLLRQLTQQIAARSG